jgi:Contractile injection system tape measure protein
VNNSNKHIINKLFFEVNTNSKKKAYYLKDNIDLFIKAELFPLLETYFDSLDKKNLGQSIQIEKLDFDLSVNPDLNFDDIKLDIINKFKEQVEEQIEKDFSSTDEYSLVSNEEKHINGFLFFLETGTTPWWSLSKNSFNINTEDDFQEITNNKNFVAKLLNVLVNPIIRSRFIKQFSDEQIYIILKRGFEETTHLEGEKPISFQKIKQNIEKNISKSKLTLNQRNLIWEITILTLLDKSDSIIIKQKLVYLITSLIKSDKIYNLHLVSEQITEHIANKSVLDILGNLTNIVLVIENKLKNKLPNIDSPINENLNDFDKLNKKSKENKQTNALNSQFSIENKSNESGSKKLEKMEQENLKHNKEIKKHEVLDISQFPNEEKISDVASNYYIDNAGLILIHPFLKQLFENCKLLDKDNTINDPEIAVHLLHYIATKGEQDYENTMLLEKFLCNIPINQTINRNIILPEAFKNHGNEMLQAILGHWGSLKNSSIDLLRNEYLQRPGKIILTEENPKIIVERKTQDILLDKITWNISVVKLAWKNKIIFVEW